MSDMGTWRRVCLPSDGTLFRLSSTPSLVITPPTIAPRECSSHLRGTAGTKLCYQGTSAGRRANTPPQQRKFPTGVARMRCALHSGWSRLDMTNTRFDPSSFEIFRPHILCILLVEMGLRSAQARNQCKQNFLSGRSWFPPRMPRSSSRSTIRQISPWDTQNNCHCRFLF